VQVGRTARSARRNRSELRVRLEKEGAIVKGQKRGNREMKKPKASPTPLMKSQWKSRWLPSVPTRAIDGHEGIDDE
jgi:hypothetical protein